GPEPQHHLGLGVDEVPLHRLVLDHRLDLRDVGRAHSAHADAALLLEWVEEGLPLAIGVAPSPGAHDHLTRAFEGLGPRRAPEDGVHEAGQHRRAHAEAERSAPELPAGDPARLVILDQPLDALPLHGMSLLARAAPRVRRPAGAWPRVCAEL